MSSWLLLFGLGVAWAAVLVPDFLRRNAVSRRSDTIGQFARNLSTLQSAAPVRGRRPDVIDLRDGAPRLSARTPVLASGPRPRSRTQQRRQDILTAMVGAALLSFLASVSLGGVATTINLGIDLLLAAYIGALLTVTRRERMRAQVGSLYTPEHRSFARPDTRMVTPSPVMAQRRSVAR